MQDIEPSHTLVTGDDIGRGITFRMADMQSLAGRIGEHVQHIEFRPGAILVRPDRRVFLPVALPLGLNSFGIVNHQMPSQMGYSPSWRSVLIDGMSFLSLSRGYGRGDCKKNPASSAGRVISESARYPTIV